MTSATTKPAASGRHTEGRGFGLVIFAGIMLAWLGAVNLIYGIAAVANSHGLIAKGHFVFGTLHWWGWATLIVAVLQVLAGGAVVLGNELARWFGVAMVGLNAIAQMFMIPAYPWWSLVIIAVDIVALYALCAYGSRANVDAIWAGRKTGAP